MSTIYEALEGEVGTLEIQMVVSKTSDAAPLNFMNERPSEEQEVRGFFDFLIHNDLTSLSITQGLFPMIYA